MATAASGDFEHALGRLEEIVAKLEGGSISLDESVALFGEGKRLASQCETLLKNAQTSIEAASRGDGAAGSTAQPLTPRNPAKARSLFGETTVDDADPDL